MKKTKRRKYRSVFFIYGFPTKKEAMYAIWQSWGICETKDVAEDEIKRLVKAGRMLPPKRDDDRHIQEVSMRVG